MSSKTTLLVVLGTIFVCALIYMVSIWPTGGDAIIKVQSIHPSGDGSYTIVDDNGYWYTTRDSSIQVNKTYKISYTRYREIKEISLFTFGSTLSDCCRCIKPGDTYIVCGPGEVKTYSNETGSCCCNAECFGVFRA